MMILASGSGALRGARIGGVGGLVIAPIMTEMAVKGQVTNGYKFGDEIDNKVLI